MQRLTLAAFVVAALIAPAAALTHEGRGLSPGVRLIHSIDHAAAAAQGCQRELGGGKTRNPRGYARPHSRGFRIAALERWHDRRRGCLAEKRRRARYAIPPLDGCLLELIRREGSGFVLSDPSTWAAAARVPNRQGSGAYGIPQALPGSKMASAGADWATNPATQLRWMIGYVNGRYGGSCAAVSHHNAAGYY